MIYNTLEEAEAAAIELAEAVETIVKITKTKDGKYELFGSGDVVKTIEQEINMKKLVIGAVLATLVATPVLAEKTRVNNVYDITRTVTKKIPNTETICKTVEVPIYGKGGMDTEGAIIGGLIGGVLGNQIGKGGGKDAATGIGAMTGAIIGGKGGNQQIVGYRQEQRCENHTTYTYETNEVYSHSVIEFYYNGRYYKESFQK